MPGEFGTCPRCKQMKARWEVTRNGRPWYRCHRFPTCLVALNLARIAASYPHLDANLAAPKNNHRDHCGGVPRWRLDLRSSPFSKMPQKINLPTIFRCLKLLVRQGKTLCNSTAATWKGWFLLARSVLRRTVVTRSIKPISREGMSSALVCLVEFFFKLSTMVNHH